MQKIKNLLLDLGGVVLDIDFSKTKMAFVDKLGNEFQTTPDIIKANYKRKIN